MYVCIHMYIYRAEFKKRKVIRNFCKIATLFGKVIRNCESLFATHSHFCIICIFVCKKRKFGLKKV